MPRFILSSEAGDDLEEIVRFIAQDNPSAARRFLAKLRREIARIADTPGLGHQRTDLTDLAVRFWPVGRYLIIYRTEPDAIEVVRVLHGARDVSTLLDDTSSEV